MRLPNYEAFFVENLKKSHYLVFSFDLAVGTSNLFNYSIKMTDYSKEIDLSKLIVSCDSSKCRCERERCTKHNLQHCGGELCIMCMAAQKLKGTPKAEQIQVKDLKAGTCSSGKCSHERKTCRTHKLQHCCSTECYVCVMMKIEFTVSAKPALGPTRDAARSRSGALSMGIQTCKDAICTHTKVICSKHNIQCCSWDRCLMC